MSWYGVPSGYVVDIIDLTTLCMFQLFDFNLQIFAFGMFVEGMSLFYDRIFSHPVISILWSAIRFDLHTFKEHLTMLSAFMIGNGMGALLVMSFGMFALKANSKLLHVIVSNASFLKWNSRKWWLI